MNRTWKTALLAHQENVQRCRNFGEGLMLLERHGAPPPFGIYAAHADWPVMVPVKTLEEHHQHVSSARVLGAPDMAIRWVRLTMGANQHEFRMALGPWLAWALGVPNCTFTLQTPEQLTLWAEALKRNVVPYDRLPTDAATFAAYCDEPSGFFGEYDDVEEYRFDDGGYRQRWGSSGSKLPRPRILAYDVALRLFRHSIIGSTLTPTSFVMTASGLVDGDVKLRFTERGEYLGSEIVPRV